MRCYPSLRYVDPFNLQPDDIELRDVFYHLSHIGRYTGAVPRFFSVLEHSIYVVGALALEKATAATQLAGLLHDGGEAYLNDLARPVKHRPEMVAYREAEARAAKVVWDACGAGTPDWTAVHDADGALGVLERDYFWRGIQAPDFMKWCQYPAVSHLGAAPDPTVVRAEAQRLYRKLWYQILEETDDVRTRNALTVIKGPA